MGREVTATGTLRAGKLRLDDKDAFALDLEDMPDGSIVLKVELVTPKALRSIKANRYYFGCVLDLMAKDTGNDREVIHDDMCARFLSRTVAYVNKATGEVEERHVAGRSSKLQPEEFWEFVEQVRLFAAEFLGLTIPDPDPAWRTTQMERTA